VIVEEFCCLGDMISVDADAVVIIRICSSWFKFRSMASTEMFPCCCEERFMTHVYGVACFTDASHGFRQK